jgi:hypothetical protein
VPPTAAPTATADSRSFAVRDANGSRTDEQPREPTPVAEESPQDQPHLDDSPEPALAEGSPAELEAPRSEDEGEQVMARTSISSLELRFAPGRDTLAQVARRVVGNGVVWLGVPFRTQLDSSEFQFVNCGPASLAMVLAAFGLEVDPSHIRDYLNTLIDNYSKDRGTGLDTLSQIARQAGLTPIDLYAVGRGYREWSTEAVRWHVEQGRPVITLVKYRNLPGHGRSPSEIDHYIVITGLTPGGFIYNDAGFATTVGYGLEISNAELEAAWDNSAIRRHAVAMALADRPTGLSFLERPAPSPTPTLIASAPRFSRFVPDPFEEREDWDVSFGVAPSSLASSSLVAVSSLPAVAEPFHSAELPSEPVGQGVSLASSDSPLHEPAAMSSRSAPELVVLLGSIWSIALAWFAGSAFLRARR